MDKKLLIVQVAALGWDFLHRNGVRACEGLEFKPADSVLPALTCTVQGSFRTASPPSTHGMVANGLYFRDVRRTMFWEQSSDLVAGERIWTRFRRRGGRVGMMFWQQSLGERVDLVLSPAPIHKHHGGMIQDCYCQPSDLYQRLRARLGKSFKLMHYWGPLASAAVGDWIAAATAAVLEDRESAPDLLLTYLPSLDYELQRVGPSHARSRVALERTIQQLAAMISAARSHDYDVLVYGDYAIADAAQAVFPNRALRAAGLLAVRQVKQMLYPDFHASRAFALVDHEIAHVYVRDPDDVQAAAECLRALDGVERVLDRREQADAGLDHRAGGELVVVAREGAWLAYPWWQRKREAPEYATHVDIHNKPGYDPCELFSGWPPIVTVSQDPSRVRGSHGRVGPGRQVAWASTLALDESGDVIALARGVRDWL